MLDRRRHEIALLCSLYKMSYILTVFAKNDDTDASVFRINKAVISNSVSCDTATKSLINHGKAVGGLFVEKIRKRGLTFNLYH